VKIDRIESWKEHVPLSRPYTIARGTHEAVELFFVRLISDGREIGLGSASPAEPVTGESAADCAAALDEARLAPLIGRDPRQLGTLCTWAGEELAKQPAARAAVDMALHDLFGRLVGVAVVDLLGRRSPALPTSITLGIQSTNEALEEVREYLGRGFTCLKVKLGISFDEDMERLRKIREEAGPQVRIRADANEGYSADETRRIAPLLEELDVEFLEQPMPAAADDEFARLPQALRDRLALDESIHDERDALTHAHGDAAPGTYVIKLMKAGGISPAVRLARIAEAGGRRLMWGCMDESAVSIAAALHAAYACPATRYLDLDGNFDLARDPAEGGFRVESGKLILDADAGLGVRMRD